jgi:DNA mismatch repair ATPase MutL
VAEKNAAGEVVGAASVVQELVENVLEENARSVRIEDSNRGKNLQSAH